MLDLRLALPDDGQLVGDRELYTRCPNHQDNGRNLAVYPHALHCYVCNFHIGVSRCKVAGCVEGSCRSCQAQQRHALAVLLGHEVTDQEQQRYTVERLDAYRQRAGEEARRDPLPDTLATVYHQLLMGPRSSRLAWLYARGLTHSAVTAFSLGHNGFQFTIPVFDQAGQLLMFRLRRDDEYGDKRPKYMGMVGRNGTYLYPENYLYSFEPTAVVICEGELDAVRLWQEDIPAVTVTNGAGQVSKLPEMLPAFVTHVVIATDQDEPGQAAAELTARAAEASGRTWSRLNWSTGKDVTEALQLGGLHPGDLAALLGGGVGVGRAA